MISIAIAVLVWFAVFGVLHTLTKLEKDNYLVDEKEDAENYGELLRSSVDRELNSLLFISNGLASYLSVYKDELDENKINAILEDLWSRAKHVRNLGVAVGYRFKYVYPIAGNERVIGVDLHSLPKQWPKVKMAVDTRQGILDGPLDLIQGGSGIIYRYPVFIHAIRLRHSSGTFRSFQKAPMSAMMFALLVNQVRYSHISAYNIRW